MCFAYMECILIFVVCLNDRNAVLKGPARDDTGNKQSLSPAKIRKLSRAPAVADIIVSVAVIVVQAPGLIACFVIDRPIIIDRNGAFPFCEELLIVCQTDPFPGIFFERDTVVIRLENCVKTSVLIDFGKPNIISGIQIAEYINKCLVQLAFIVFFD